MRRAAVAKTIARNAAADTSAAVSGAIETLSAGLIHIKPSHVTGELNFGMKFISTTPTGARVGYKLDACSKSLARASAPKSGKKMLKVRSKKSFTNRNKLEF